MTDALKPCQSLVKSLRELAEHKHDDLSIAADAAQRIAELEAENRILNAKCAASLANNLCPDHRDKQTFKPCLACTIERLEAENERLRKDAERYRWLRDTSEPPHNFYISVPVEFHGVRYQPHEVDQYIDKVIAALKESER